MPYVYGIIIRSSVLLRHTDCRQRREASYTEHIKASREAVCPRQTDESATYFQCGVAPYSSLDCGKVVGEAETSSDPRMQPRYTALPRTPTMCWRALALPRIAVCCDEAYVGRIPASQDAPVYPSHCDMAKN